MSIKDDEMKDIIEEAKKQVLNWHNSEADQVFIETSIWSDSLQFGDGAGNLTKLLILHGKEAKGTILADYFNGIVVAYDRNFNQIRMWKTIFK